MAKRDRLITPRPLTVRVYRLAVTYPPGRGPGSGWEPDDWAEWCRDEYVSPIIDTLIGFTGWGGMDDWPPPFRWPTRLVFLSKVDANISADWFRRWGATVTVAQSNPVEWPATPRDGHSP